MYTQHEVPEHQEPRHPSLQTAVPGHPPRHGGRQEATQSAGRSAQKAEGDTLASVQGAAHLLPRGREGLHLHIECGQAGEERQGVCGGHSGVSEQRGGGGEGGEGAVAMVHSVPEAGGGGGGSGEEGAVSRSVSAGGRVDGDRGGVVRGMSGVLRRSEHTVLLPRHPATPGVPRATDAVGQSVGAGGGELSHEPRKGAESDIWGQAKVTRVRASDREISERV